MPGVYRTFRCCRNQITLKALLVVAIIHCSVIAWPQSVKPLDNGSSIVFHIKNFGLQVDGRFTGLHGQITFNPKDLADAFFDLSVKTSTVNTGIQLRDNHLRKSEYFDVTQFPTMRFVSKRVEAGNDQGTFTAVGTLTIKNITKDISFPFEVESSNDLYVFKGTFSLNRRDFNVGSGSLTLSDELIVTFSIRASINK